jgi:hypothetical protein
VLSLFWRCTGEKIVEYVEIPLARGGTCYAVAFEIVVEGLDPAEAPAFGELELGIFSKAGRIRVEKGRAFPNDSRTNSVAGI